MNIHDDTACSCMIHQQCCFYVWLMFTCASLILVLVFCLPQLLPLSSFSLSPIICIRLLFACNPCSLSLSFYWYLSFFQSSLSISHLSYHLTLVRSFIFMSNKHLSKVIAENTEKPDFLLPYMILSLTKSWTVGTKNYRSFSVLSALLK